MFACFYVGMYMRGQGLEQLYLEGHLYRELNSGPLQEDYMLSPAEPLLEPR